MDDIKAVQEQASLKRLAMTVQLVLDVESMLPDFILRRLTVRTMTVYPNQRKKNFIAKLWRGDFAMKEVADKMMADAEKVGRGSRAAGSECRGVRMLVRRIEKDSSGCRGVEGLVGGKEDKGKRGDSSQLYVRLYGFALGCMFFFSCG